jgi:hypothetical protein
MAKPTAIERQLGVSVRLSVAVGLLALGLTGCSTLGLSRSSPDSSAMTNQYVDRGFRGDMLVSRMKPVQLRLPSGWRAAPSGTLHGNADLEAYNLDQNMFLVVLGENRTAVAPGGLEEQATIYLQLLKGGFSQVLTNQARVGTNSLNGFPAVQYEVSGNVNQQAIAYLHTTVELGEEYYQVVVWTPEDQRAVNADAMRAVVEEFRSTQL